MLSWTSWITTWWKIEDDKPAAASYAATCSIHCDRWWSGRPREMEHTICSDMNCETGPNYNACTCRLRQTVQQWQQHQQQAVAAIGCCHLANNVEHVECINHGQVWACAPSQGDLGPHVIQESLDPSECTSQTASRHSSQSCPTDRQTN